MGVSLFPTRKKGSSGSATNEVNDLRATVSALSSRLELVRSKQRHSSGVPMSYGEFDYEANAKWSGSAKWLTLDKMETDPQVKESLRVNTLPLITAEWEYEPASDDPRDIDIAEFVSANLLRTTSDKYGREYWIQTPWEQRLYEILRMLRDGRSIFASSMRQVGTKKVYDRLQWIEPATVDGMRPWQIDKYDNILGVNRTYTTPDDEYEYEKFLPAEQIKLYTWELLGARYDGRSFIRSMYGAHYRKERIQRWAAIWAQKVGAPVPLGTYPKGWDASYINAFEDFVMSMRGEAPAEAFGMFEQDADGRGPKVEYAGSSATLDRGVTDLINNENAEMARVGGTKSGLLGETSSGSRSLGESQATRENVLIEAVASFVCAWENHGVANLKGVVEELVEINFAGVKAMPQLVCSKINPDQGKSDSDTIIKAYTAGIIPKHEDFKRQFTERYGFNLPDDAYEVVEPPPLPVVPPPGTEPDEEIDEPDDEQAAASLEAKETFRKRIAGLLEPVQEGAPKGGGFRYPNRLESGCCNLAAVAGSFRVGERDILSDLRAARRDMMNDLMARLRNGKITPRNLDGQRRSKFRQTKKHMAAMVATFQRVGSEGMAHVKDELTKQRRR
jgi:hypothetical protein